MALWGLCLFLSGSASLPPFGSFGGWEKSCERENSEAEKQTAAVGADAQLAAERWGKCKYRCRGAVLLALCKVCGYYSSVLIVSRYCTSCRVSLPSLKKGGPRMAAVAVDNAAASAVRRPTTKKMHARAR